MWIFAFCLVFKVLTKSDLLPETTLKVEHRSIFIVPKNDGKQKKNKIKTNRLLAPSAESKV